MRIKDYIYFSVLSIALMAISCSSPNNATEEKQAEENISKTASEEPNDQVEAKYLPVLKEQLFFHIRGKILDFDDMTFVKYEQIKIEDNRFRYDAVIIDQRRLIPNYSHNASSNTTFKLASYIHDETNDILGDTIKIEGKYQLLDQSVTPESTLKEFQINILAEYETSYILDAPYGYGEFMRGRDGTEIDQNLIVRAYDNHSYSKEELYLKARIFELVQDDLSGLNTEDLAYLRNEIFARHGHTFKTEKMQNHFNNELWYRPFFDDASEFLNEMEKKNVQYIRSLES